MSDPFRYFRIEAHDLLQQMGRGVLELERGSSAGAAVPGLLRLAHTLKGAARVVRQNEIAGLAHAIEDALAPWDGERSAIPPEELGALNVHLEAIAAHLQQIALPVAPEPVASPAPVVETARVVRADVAEIDALVEGLGAAQLQLASVRMWLGDVERARRMAEQLEMRLEAGPLRERNVAGDVPIDRGGVRDLARELRALTAQLDRRLVSGLDAAARELADVRAATERLRLVSAASIVDVLERVARDGARSLGKPLTFEARGRELRLDAGVLGLAQGALVQLVRNAVAHGLERESERRAQGKPASGRVDVAVERRAEHIVFSCRDDGRGVDLDAVRSVAQRKGVRPADGVEMSAAELLALVMRGGLSTSTAVTELSGRGVGLDVVRDAAARLGGEVRVETVPRAGTCIELWVPDAVSSLDALVVEHEGRRAAIPIDGVKTTLRVEASAIVRGELFVEGEGSLPFVPLAACLGERGITRTLPWSVVVLAVGAQRGAFGVDRVIGLQHVIARPMPALAALDRVVAGAILDERGDPVPVLAPSVLVERARSVAPTGEPSLAEPLPILVIDDSLTTRMLEQSILESAGFVVHLASSGEEALEKARAARYACFLVDVEMPGMDGFEFVQRTQSDGSLRGIPSILITSRASMEDRAHGERVGARAYIAKGEFDQAVLLARIRELVGVA